MPSIAMDGLVSTLGLSAPEGGLSLALAIGLAAKLLAALSWLALFLLIVVIYLRRPDLFVRQTYLLLGAAARQARLKFASPSVRPRFGSPPLRGEDAARPDDQRHRPRSRCRSSIGGLRPGSWTW